MPSNVEKFPDEKTHEDPYDICAAGPACCGDPEERHIGGLCFDCEDGADEHVYVAASSACGHHRQFHTGARCLVCILEKASHPYHVFALER